MLHVNIGLVCSLTFDLVTGSVFFGGGVEGLVCKSLYSFEM